MSALKWIQQNSKTLAKGSLYLAGGLAIGWPVVKGVQVLWKGGSVDAAAETVVIDATGYYPGGGEFNQGKARNAIIRDILGVGAIYVAKKL